MTIAELKRKLQIGTPLKMVYTIWGNTAKIGVVRYVVKTQGNGIYLSENKEDTKGSFLEFPKASLFEMTEKGFKFFKLGFRDLTEEERQILNNQPEDEEQLERDLLTDTNIMYYRRKQYFKDVGYEYLSVANSKLIQGKKLMNGKVLDEAVKGDLSIEYEFC